MSAWTRAVGNTKCPTHLSIQGVLRLVKEGCFFDAIRLERSHPEFANYCSADDTVKKVVLNGARRAGRIAIRSLTKREN